MKRLIGVILVLALLCSLIPMVSAWNVYFFDVPSNSWYYEAVQYAVQRGLMNGMGNNCFEPDMQMSRAMLVTVLWRYAGSPKEGENSFSDVNNGIWYSDAIAWATAKGVVTGIGNGKFDPDGIVTREQLAVVLYRYSRSLSLDTSNMHNLNSFPDGDSVSFWAKVSLSWAVAEGLIKGNQTGSQVYLQPQDSATRAQVAAILMRYIEKYCGTVCPHTQTELRNAEDATCLSSGYSGDLYCMLCGYCLCVGESLAATSHNYVNGVCTVCGEHRNTETLEVGGKSYALEMTTAELTSLAGSPDETLPVAAGYTWYVYGTDDYRDFFMAGIYEDTIISLCATGVGFTYRGKRMGNDLPSVSDAKCNVRLCTDSNDNNIFYAVHLTDLNFNNQKVFTTETLASESRVNFHLANAFRVYHGRGILKWSNAAATAARLHSEDMATQNYFSHYSPDGRGPDYRLSQQGIPWLSCSENICAGYRSGFEAYNGWVNSEGHRDNILSERMEYLGVGFAVSSSSTYYIYATQNFYTQ